MTIKELKFGSTDYLASVKLRDKILRKPLGMIFTDDFLAQDENQFNIGIFKNNEIIGVLILQPLYDKILRMRQVAVDNKYQGKGIGKKLVNFSEKFAIAKGYSSIELNARNSAIPFYKRLNYSIIGEEFYEVGLPHYKMIKKLT